MHGQFSVSCRPTKEAPTATWREPHMVNLTMTAEVFASYAWPILSLMPANKRSPHGNVAGASHGQPNDEQRPTSYAVERKIGFPEHDCRDRNQVGRRLDCLSLVPEFLKAPHEFEIRFTTLPVETICEILTVDRARFHCVKHPC